jgi:hypothetical protein
VLASLERPQGDSYVRVTPWSIRSPTLDTGCRKNTLTRHIEAIKPDPREGSSLGPCFKTLIINRLRTCSRLMEAACTEVARTMLNSEAPHYRYASPRGQLRRYLRGDFA